jgi:hypothetical protein
MLRNEREIALDELDELIYGYQNCVVCLLCVVRRASTEVQPLVP